MKLPERILLKLQKMNQYLEELDELLPADEEEYVKSLALRRACEKTIEAAIEEVLDILSLVISYLQLGLPQNEESIIIIAAKKKIISPALAEKIKRMKGFRNILVHRYGEIDDARSYSFLSGELPDFLEFEQEIRKALHVRKSTDHS